LSMRAPVPAVAVHRSASLPMKVSAFALAVALLIPLASPAAEFGTKGGPEPANLADAAAVLRLDPYDLELLISFGTSKGGSAGHLALAIRDDDRAAEDVYSANFYADRAAKHATGFYNRELMVRIPKVEYLFRTSSSVDGEASFGLDFGEIYKRSVVGVRVYGVPAGEKHAVAAYFARINDDFRAGARNTEYHEGEVRYDYLQLNCAKTIGSAFRYGAGYRDLDVRRSPALNARRVASALRANVPTDMAMKLVQAWHARGYRMDVVLYRKYPASPYVDPHEDEKVAFRELPDRFPSVLSRDFRRDAGAYKDFDNLYAMYLLFNLGTLSVAIDESTGLVRIDRRGTPMRYEAAAEDAYRSARSDSDNYRRKTLFRPKGTRIGEDVDAR
jgi:hypothetical protein